MPDQESLPHDEKQVMHIDVKDEDDGVEWQLCCSRSSKSFIKYVTTVMMSVIILIFSIVMIYGNPTENNSIYFSLISSILTLYVPAPTLDHVKS